MEAGTKERKRQHFQPTKITSGIPSLSLSNRHTIRPSKYLPFDPIILPKNYPRNVSSVLLNSAKSGNTIRGISMFTTIYNSQDTSHNQSLVSRFKPIDTTIPLIIKFPYEVPPKLPSISSSCWENTPVYVGYGQQIQYHS